MLRRWSCLCLLALWAPSCSDRVVDSPPGQPGGVCRDEEPRCDEGLACSDAGQCFDLQRPCEGYDCGEGTCSVVDGTPVCECSLGEIHSEASAPCRISNAVVEQSPGQPGGLCLAPVGYCNDGITCNIDKNFCYRPEDPCDGFACGGHDRGRCEPADGLPTCLCEPGFDNEQYDLYCCPQDGSDPRCT